MSTPVVKVTITFVARRRDRWVVTAPAGTIVLNTEEGRRIMRHGTVSDFDRLVEVLRAANSLENQTPLKFERV